MEGILLVDKPTAWTSFDVVNYVRKLIAKTQGVPPRTLKVGHSGTLDPFASGLLLILVGKKYTTRSELLLKQDKIYQVMAELGRVSSTGDPEGVIEETTPSPVAPSHANVVRILKRFRGEVSQTPPSFSAIKVNGVRAYRLARQNKNEAVNLPKRKVKIKSLKLVVYDFPMLSFTAEVSSGTYVRSLVEDIGKELQVGAYTRELRRIAIGNYSVEDASKVSELTEQTIAMSLLHTS